MTTVIDHHVLKAMMEKAINFDRQQWDRMKEALVKITGKNDDDDPAMKRHVKKFIEFNEQADHLYGEALNVVLLDPALAMEHYEKAVAIVTEMETYLIENTNYSRTGELP